MKKTIQIVMLLSMMALGVNSAQAGVAATGTSVSTGMVGVFVTEEGSEILGGVILGGSILGGAFGVSAITAGAKLVQTGSIGWGVFLIVLEEEGVKSADLEILEGLDVSSQEAVIEILASDLDEATKSEMLNEVLM